MWKTELIKNILLTTEYRPLNMDILVDLCINLSESCPTLDGMQEALLNGCLTNPNLNLSNGFFMSKGIVKKYFTSKMIAEAIKKSQEYELDYCGGGVFFALTFSPEIEEALPDYYKFIMENVAEQYKMMPDLEEFFLEFEKLKDNNWKGLFERRTLGCNHHEIAVMMMRDEIDKLQQIATSPNFDFDQRVKQSAFGSTLLTNFEPTLIHICAFYGSINCFRFLLLNGADINLCDKLGRSVAQFAVAGGNYEIIRILQSQNADFKGAAHFAALYHRNSVLYWMINNKVADIMETDRMECLILHKSVESYNIETFIYCIDHGLDVNLSDIDHKTPLFIAATKGFTVFVELLLSCDNIDVNGKTSQQLSPLYGATISGFASIVQMILARPDVDVNVISCNETPLYFACENGYYTIVQSLLNHPAIDINIKNTKTNMTPLQIAEECGYDEIVELIENHGLVSCNE